MFAAVVNFGGLVDLLVSFFQMCFWPGLIAVAVIVAVVAVGKR